MATPFGLSPPLPLSDSPTLEELTARALALLEQREAAQEASLRPPVAGQAQNGSMMGGLTPDTALPDPELSDTRPRHQWWPEKLVRSATTLPGDVYRGDVPVMAPGLRREDFTDIPAPGKGEGEAGIFGNRMFKPVAAQPNDPMMERAQDTAGLAMSGALPAAVMGGVAGRSQAPIFGSMGGAGWVSTPAKNWMIENADAFKRAALHRRNEGIGPSPFPTFKTTEAVIRAQGGDATAPGSFERLAAEQKANYRSRMGGIVDEYNRAANPERYADPDGFTLGDDYAPRHQAVFGSGGTDKRSAAAEAGNYRRRADHGWRSA